MSDDSIDSTARVLHIRPSKGQSDCVAEMDARLSGSDLSVETNFDVYCGLARTCKAPAGTYLALIVCMDALGTNELEFFSIIARARPRLPIYIYGETATGTRKACALATGAIGATVDDVIRRLGGTRAIEFQTKSVDEPPSPIAAETIVTTGESDGGMLGLDESGGSKDEDFSRPVQVPWVSRADTPARERPGDREPSEDLSRVEAFESERATVRGLHEPLLTEEELRALIGDESPDVSSDDPDSLISDDLDDGEIV